MSCSSSGETNCINTASGNCHSVLVALPPTPTPSAKRHGTNFTEVWVGPRTGLNEYEKEKSLAFPLVSKPNFSLRC